LNPIIINLADDVILSDIPRMTTGRRERYHFAGVTGNRKAASGTLPACSAVAKLVAIEVGVVRARRNRLAAARFPTMQSTSPGATVNENR
jgi:hypothetical protein